MRDRGLLGLSLLMVAGLLMAGFLQLYVVAPQPALASPDSATVVPNAKHTGDDTGDSLSGITGDDATENPDTLSKMRDTDNVYTVVRDKVMYLDTFDVSSIPEGATITAAVLHLQYGAQTGYDGTNPVSYDNGGGLTTTGITPTDITGWSADLTFDLYGAGVDTKSEIQNVDIEFISNDSPPGDAIHFDYVWIEVTYTPPQPPTVTSVALYDAGGTAEVTSMTPYTAYDVKVTVTNAEGKSELKTIVLKIYYDSNGGTPTEGESDGKTAHTQNCAIITWTEGTGFALTDMAPTTWSLGTCVEPADLASPFEFKFTAGKVATQAVGGAAPNPKWQITAKVTDDANQTGWNYDADGASMQWYGEVAVGPTEVDWGTLAPGAIYTETVQSITPVTYIANGAYDEKVKTLNMSWGGATMVTTDPTATDTFALKADDTATFANADFVSTTPILINNTGTQTGEAGVEVTANHLWLQLASTFTSGTYNGTIYYIIAEHV